MRAFFAGLAGAMLWVSSAAAFDPVAASSASPFSLRLGSQFVPVLITCGTPQNPQCPRYTEPVGRPYLIHYVTVGGRADIFCSFASVVRRQKSDGSLESFGLTRMTLWGDSVQSPSRLSWDNTVLTFPKPIRGEAGDTLGVVRSPVTGDSCSVFATFGIEYLQ